MKFVGISKGIINIQNDLSIYGLAEVVFLDKLKEIFSDELKGVLMDEFK